MKNINKEEKISLSVWAFALAVLGVPFSGGNLSLMYYYPVILIVLGLAMLSLIRERIHLKIQHACILVLCLILVYHIDVSIQYFEESKSLGSLILFFALFFVMTMHPPKLSEIKLVCRCFGYSGIIISLLLLIFKQEYEMGRYSYPVGGRLLEVNYLACYLSITFAFVFHKALTTGGLKKVGHILGSFLILYAIFLTGSRMGFLSAIGIVLPVLLLHKPQKMLFKIIIALLVIVVAFSILPEHLTNRFLHRSYNDGSNRNRILLFKNAMYFISLKPMLGYGAISGRVITGWDSAHNTFLAALLHFGFIGLWMYLIILLKNIKILFQRDMFCFLSVWLILIFSSMIINNGNTIPFWFGLILLYWVIEYKMKNPSVDLWNSL